MKIGAMIMAGTLALATTSLAAAQSTSGVGAGSISGSSSGMSRGLEMSGGLDAVMSGRSSSAGAGVSTRMRTLDSTGTTGGLFGIGASDIDGSGAGGR